MLGAGLKEFKSGSGSVGDGHADSVEWVKHGRAGRSELMEAGKLQVRREEACSTQGLDGGAAIGGSRRR